MQIEMKKSGGVRLLTEGKTCADNIEVVPKLETLNATENGEYTPSEGHAGFSSVNVNVAGEGLAINGVIKQYKVNAGAQVNAGDFVEFVNKYGEGGFGSTTPNYLRACKISANGVLVAYAYSSKTYAVALEIGEDGYISVGAQKTVANVALTTYLTALSDNVALLSGGSITSVLEISDGVITVKYSAETACYGAVALDANTAMGTYYSVGTAGTNQKSYAAVIKINDDGITRLTYPSLSSSAMISGKGVKLTDKKALFTYAYYTGNEPKEVNAFVAFYDESSVSVGSYIKIASSGYASRAFAAALTDELVIAVCSDSSVGYATVITVGGTTCTKTAQGKFSDNAVYSSVCALSGTKALITYSDNLNSGYGVAVVAETDGTTITFSSPVVFADATITESAVTALSDSSVLVTYNQNGGGKYKTLTIDDMTITVDNEQTGGTFVQPATSTLHNIGVAKSAGTAGETVEVYCVKKE